MPKATRADVSLYHNRKRGGRSYRSLRPEVEEAIIPLQTGAVAKGSRLNHHHMDCRGVFIHVCKMYIHIYIYMIYVCIHTYTYIYGLFCSRFIRMSMDSFAPVLVYVAKDTMPVTAENNWGLFYAASTQRLRFHVI